MIWIEGKDIDRKRWDELVEKSGNTVFNLAAYLDSTAENWCLLAFEDYSGGIAVPFTVRLGIKTVYTPFFLRYVAWCGSGFDAELILTEIKKRFSGGYLFCTEQFEAFANQKRIFQEITPTEIPVLHEQAKRMLKKFNRSSITLNQEVKLDQIEEVIRMELPQKVTELDDHVLQLLHQLIQTMYTENRVFCMHASEADKTVGGLVFLRFGDRLLYLKGAFTAASKKNGAMYAAMQEAIQVARAEKHILDFGGSQVEGVRRFNVNLGGKDQTYYEINWDQTPFWFRLLKKLRDKWKKK